MTGIIPDDEDIDFLPGISVQGLKICDCPLNVCSACRRKDSAEAHSRQKNKSQQYCFQHSPSSDIRSIFHLLHLASLPNSPAVTSSSLSSPVRHLRNSAYIILFHYTHPGCHAQEKYVTIFVQFMSISLSIHPRRIPHLKRHPRRRGCPIFPVSYLFSLRLLQFFDFFPVHGHFPVIESKIRHSRIFRRKTGSGEVKL